MAPNYLGSGYQRAACHERVQLLGPVRLLMTNIPFDVSASLLHSHLIHDKGYVP